MHTKVNCAYLFINRIFTANIFMPYDGHVYKLTTLIRKYKYCDKKEIANLKFTAHQVIIS